MSGIMQRIPFMNNFAGGGGGNDDNGSSNFGADDEPMHIEGDDDSNPFSALGDLFNEDDDDDDDSKKGQGGGDDDDDDDSGKPKQKKGSEGKTPEQEMAEEIQGMLAGLTIKEDLLPENFDPSDPKQFRDVVGKIQQQTALATIQMAFKPMQAAIASLSKEMKAEIQNSLRDFGGKNQARTALEAIVPEVNDENLRGLVETLHSQAQKKFKKPGDAAQSVRKALDAMGIKSSGRSQRDSDPSQEGFRTGNSALDLFAPLPKKKAPQQNAGK